MQSIREMQMAAGVGYYIPYVQPRRGAVIGDEVYFTLRYGNAIVKYDWSRNCLSMINQPSPSVSSTLGFPHGDGGQFTWVCLH